MKRILFITAICLCFTITYSQQLEHYTIPTELIGESRIIHVQEHNSQKRAFIIKKESVSGRIIDRDNEDVDINVLHVIDIKGGRMTEHNRHVLYQGSFPMGRKFEFKAKKNRIGTEEDVVTYDQVMEKYPELNHIKKLDDQNRSRTEELYQTRLILPSLGTKIKGFEMKKFTTKQVPKEEQAKPKKKKGLMNKLANAAVKLDGLQKSIDGSGAHDLTLLDEGQLDWESSYGGGQNKKNKWMNIFQYSDEISGNVLACNGHDTKEDKGSYYKNHEIVLFDKMGNVLNREEINTEIEYTVEDTKVEWNKDDNYMFPKTVVQTLRKRRPKAQGASKIIRAINGKGELVYMHKYSFAGRSLEDLLYFNVEDQVATVAYSLFNSNDVLVFQSTPDSQNQWTIEADRKSKPYYITNYADEIVAFYKVGERPNSFVIKKASGSGENIGSFTSSLEDEYPTEFEVLHCDNDKIVFQIKEKIERNFMDMKFPIVHTTMFEYGESGVIKLSDSSEDQRILFSDDLNQRQSFVKTDSGSYTLSGLIKPNPKKRSENMAFKVITFIKD